MRHDSFAFAGSWDHDPDRESPSPHGRGQTRIRKGRSRGAVRLSPKSGEGSSAPRSPRPGRWHLASPRERSGHSLWVLPATLTCRTGVSTAVHAPPGEPRQGFGRGRSRARTGQRIVPGDARGDDRSDPHGPRPVALQIRRLTSCLPSRLGGGAPVRRPADTSRLPRHLRFQAEISMSCYGFPSDGHADAARCLR